MFKAASDIDIGTRALGSLKVWTFIY
jgi:hypothetical protein